MSELSEALGRGKELTLAGQTLHISPLNFADLADLEEALEDDPLSDQELSVIEALTKSQATNATAYQNPLSRLKPMKLAHQLLILHLCLRHSQPKLTRADVAALITARQYQKPETTEFLSEMLRVSGVLGEDDPQDAPAEPEAEPEKKKARTRAANTSA